MVYVHAYDMLGHRTPLLYALRVIILAVQMPLFLFLCGYFGKNTEKRRSTAIAEYLIPFWVFNTLYYLMRADQVEKLKYGIFRPLNMYWFLMTLLLIRLLMPELIRIRGILPASVCLALFAGGDPTIGRTLSLSRTICFLPFYLLGYYCSEREMKRIRTMPAELAWMCGLTGAWLTLAATGSFPIRMKKSHPFQLVSSYKTQGLTEAEGMLFRLIIYLAAPLLAVLLIRMMSQKQSVLTRIGRGSMTVYLLHAFPLLWLIEHKEELCEAFVTWFPQWEGMGEQLAQLRGGIPQMMLWVVYAFAVSWVLSCRPVAGLYAQLQQELQYLIFRRKDEEKGKTQGIL